MASPVSVGSVAPASARGAYAGSAESYRIQRPAIFAEEHSNPKGPSDARPTARQIIETEGLVGALPGKVFLVTGCSSGIGVETARALHATGADTYMTARDIPKAQAVAADIRRSNPNSKGKIEVVRMELDKLASVREGAADFLKRSDGKLHALVCNAGVGSCPYSKTKDGFEHGFAVNHLAHFVLFQAVQSALLSSATPAFPSRVVMVSSGAHQLAPVDLDDYNFDNRPFQPHLGYGQGKTANVWMALEIEKRFGAQHLHATSLMPGVILSTELSRHTSKEALQAMTSHPITQSLLKSAEQGAATTAWAAVGHEWHDKGGVYLEDCAVGLPKDPNEPPFIPRGYAPHAYDADSASKLWELSAKIIQGK